MYILYKACNLGSQQFEIALVVDNSGGLNERECGIQRNNIAKLLRSFKFEEENPLVTYIEIYGKGCEVLVSFNNTLNNDINEYANFIQSLPCDDGGGHTDLACGFRAAIDELYVYKQMTNSNSLQKIISINNCQDIDNERFLCIAAKRAVNDLEIDVIFINAIPDSSTASCGNNMNPIENVDKYARCLTNGDNERICVADKINDDQFERAMDECLPEICDVPTYAPTKRPS